jgi:hypothetical protein
MKNKNKFSQHKNREIFAGLTSALLTLSACGQTAFTVVAGTQNIVAPGNFKIAPKVDVLLIGEDKGRMFETWKQASLLSSGLLTNLDQKGWDYHFASISLTTYKAITQATASAQDGNYGTAWKRPYPGARRFEAGTISPDFFRLPTLFSDFLTLDQISNSLNGFEPGFQNIEAVLTTGLGTSNFLRKDALFVPIILSLGDDTSGVNFCNAPDSTATYLHKIPCEQVSATLCNGSGGTDCGSSSDSFNQHKSWLLNFKTNTQLYAAVADQDSNSCLGGRASAGYRYKKMASALGGKSFDICTQPMNQIFDSLAGQLQSRKIANRQHYLFISQDADPSSIKVTRYTEGDTSRAVLIPQDATNGWTYAGAVTDVYAIDYPVPSNLSSGYAIQLNGAAEISDNDTASVDFKPAGAQNSVSK